LKNAAENNAGGMTMLQGAYWRLFAKTGDPGLYLAYRVACAVEKK
jgi:hypothetical protein